MNYRGTRWNRFFDSSVKNSSPKGGNVSRAACFNPAAHPCNNDLDQSWFSTTISAVRVFLSLEVIS
jgi:hypothetical protein